MSVFVMRPEAPVPETLVRSTLLSFAILRTSGDERTRSPSVAAAVVAGANAGADAAAGVAATGPAAGVAALPAPPPITATTVLMVTVAPSATLISDRIPATGDGISASTLSVEISKMGSSRWTLSPTFFSHLVIVPSVMDSPIWGIVTSVPGPLVVGVLPVADGVSTAAGVTLSAAGAVAVSTFAGGGADADSEPPSSIVQTIVLIWTVVPSAILMSFRIPADGDGISASTLSVEISNSGSSRWTVSPGFLSHLVMVPSVMDSPIWGITTSVGMNVSSP